MIAIPQLPLSWMVFVMFVRYIHVKLTLSFQSPITWAGQYAGQGGIDQGGREEIIRGTEQDMTQNYKNCIWMPITVVILETRGLPGAHMKPPNNPCLFKV